MVVPGFLLFVPSIFAIPSALAANCYGSPNPGFSVADFQQVANQVCSVGPNAQQQFGTTGYPNNYPLIIQAGYNGTEKIHCQVRNP
jgi:hypothetical protein